MISIQGRLTRPPKPARRRWKTAICTALVLALVALRSVTAAETFKPFKKLKGLDGSQQSLSDVLGTKATLVVFFFPTCPYCNAAFPEVPVLLGNRALANDYKLRMTPTHFLLDPKGGVIATHAGYTAGDERALEHDIQLALSH